jgi:hypothetical protein
MATCKDCKGYIDSLRMVCKKENCKLFYWLGVLIMPLKENKNVTVQKL